MIIKSCSINDIAPSDLSAIKMLDLNYFQFPWTESNWLNSLVSNNYFLFYDSSCHCFAIFLLSPLEKLAHLLKIVVSPEFRKKGLASSLLNASTSQFRAMGINRCILEVETTNSGAISLYSKHGYENIHLKKKFYSNGADAHIMQKHL